MNKDNATSVEQQSQETLGLLVHSYNNYLSGLMGFTELALLECNQDIVKERLNLAMDSGKDAVIFGKQLLSSISRLQVKFIPVDLKVLIAELGKKSDFLTVNEDEFDPQMTWLINTDKNWFVFCLNYLIEFCQDYSKDKNIIINLSDASSFYLIQVQSKFKLEEEQQKMLFSPFYSSRVLLGKKDIGLAMFKGFILQMGGTINWNEQQGFLIEIPKVEIKTQS